MGRPLPSLSAGFDIVLQHVGREKHKTKKTKRKAKEGGK